MSGLVLKLGPKERILINGAVIENGEKRSKLNIVTPNANILRLRDALHPNDVDTPVKRVCYSLQLVLSGEMAPTEIRQKLINDLAQLGQVFTDPKSQDALQTSATHVSKDRFYPALRSLREVLAREASVIEAMN